MKLHYKVIGAAAAIFTVGPIAWIALDRDVSVANAECVPGQFIMF